MEGQEMLKAFTLWLMGLPSSGKTTLAAAVKDKFQLIHLDSDEMRIFLTPNPQFLQNEREFVYRSMIHSCFLLNKAGVNVILSATANLERYRELADGMLTNVKKIYIDCPIEVCEKRDVKDLYKKSKEGFAATVPMRISGVNDQYIDSNYKSTDIFEPPVKCDLIINTALLSEIESIKVLSDYIQKVLKSE
jgi:adenylylsulfate kinase